VPRACFRPRSSSGLSSAPPDGRSSTLNAAWTLDLHHDRGSIEVGKRADLLVLDGPAEQIPYRFGHNPVQIALIGGEVLYVRDEAAAERLNGD
jgi:cytosine/adenosine deaminase-related metal-dependent hydrolase